jgi:hypothetical protein
VQSAKCMFSFLLKILSKNIFRFDKYLAKCAIICPQQQQQQQQQLVQAIVSVICLYSYTRIVICRPITINAGVYNAF